MTSQTAFLDRGRGIIFRSAFFLNCRWCPAHPRKAFASAKRLSSVSARPYTMAASLDVTTKVSKRIQPEGMQNEAHVLSQLAEVPSISKAWIREDSTDSIMHFTALYAQRNISANAQRKYVVSYTVVKEATHKDEDEDDDELGGRHRGKGRRKSESLTIVPSNPVELKDVLLYAPSPSGQKVLVVRAGKEATSGVLEIWDGTRVVAELQVPAKLHGSVFNDGWFSHGASWDPSEGRVAYVAEVPAETETPEWGSLSQPEGSQARKEESGEKSPEAAPKTWTGVGEFQEDWGELYTWKRTPGIFILDLQSCKVQQVKGTPQDSSVGQPVWSPSGKELIYVAWPHQPLNSPGLSGRLGIVYCVNRACALHCSTVPGGSQAGSQERQSVCLTPSLNSALSPKFTPDGESILFLSHSAAATSGVHNATAALCTIPWPCSSTDSVRTLVSIQRRPRHEGAFPGIYATSLPEQPFESSDGALFTTQWANTTGIASVGLRSGSRPVQVDRFFDGDDKPSWSLLAAYKGWTVMSNSAPTSVPSAFVLCTSGATETESLPHQQIPISSSPDVHKLLEGLAWKTLQLKATSAKDGEAASFDATLVLGRPRKAAPGILFLHGGPHSAYAASYVHSVAFLASLGYNVVIPNYRGSTGYGEDSIQSLPGNIGTNDVADCMAALDAAISEGLVDKDRVAVIGGSHGGFLTGNLVGQHPDRFRCGVLRNPVMDISLMVNVSDIPDWCFVEATGSKANMTTQPSADQLARFRAVSPISHVDKVQAPLLFMLGAKDRRVPLVDAQQYARALKAREGAPEVKIWVFSEDTHALDKPQTDFEQWMNVAWWLKKHSH